MSSASPPRPLAIAWLGRVGYRRAWALQEALRDRLLDGIGDETLLLLEHHPVITIGRSGDASNVLLPSAELAARGISVVRSSRGGDVTWHGPGQLVAYPVVRVDHGVRAYVESLAAAVVDVAASHGVVAAWRSECPGVWAGPALNGKLCAFGVQVHHRVAVHGLALNVTAGPEDFASIVPCGIQCSGVTSLAAQSGRGDLDIESIARELGSALARRLGREPLFLDGDAPLSGGLSRPRPGEPDMPAPDASHDA
jgi:lipoate-protein ligase B